MPSGQVPGIGGLGDAWRCWRACAEAWRGDAARLRRARHAVELRYDDEPAAPRSRSRRRPRCRPWSRRRRHAEPVAGRAVPRWTRRRRRPGPWARGTSTMAVDRANGHRRLLPAARRGAGGVPVDRARAGEERSAGGVGGTSSAKARTASPAFGKRASTSRCTQRANQASNPGGSGGDRGQPGSRGGRRARRRATQAKGMGSTQISRSSTGQRAVLGLEPEVAPGDELEGDEAERPDVGAGADAAPPVGLLGRHEERACRAAGSRSSAGCPRPAWRCRSRGSWR